MNNRLLYWAITCSLAGFIFGFDLMVISGVEQQIEKLWDLTPTQHGWAISAAIWGTVIGSLLGGIPANRFGRKKTLMAIGLLYFVSAIGSAMATDVTSFALFRILGGIGVGISTVAAPIFIAEISPAARRGRLTGMFQFNIVFGLLIATISNYIVRQVVDVDSWRWMLAVEAVPALIYSVMCLTLPESPRWLIDNNRREEGKKILAQINPDFTPEQLEAKVVEIEQADDQPQTKAGLNWGKLKLPIALAFLIAFFNQLSGINAILGFSPRIFGMTGIDTSAGLINSSLVTLVNLVFTLIGLRLIDKIGRRTLLYIGSFGYIISLGICAWAFSHFKAPFQVAEAAINFKGASALVAKADLSEQKRLRATKGFEEARAALVTASQDDAYQGEPLSIPPTLTEQENVTIAESALQKASDQTGSGSTVVLICIVGFIAAHAIGQGAVIWVFISEIFPNRARAFGQSFGSGTHWLFAALLTLLFPMAVAAFSPTALFAFFCFMMILHLLWVHFMVPETKGISLEDMEETLGTK
ncbi:MAG: sugar porter family MFS transporter [Verrucomicrobiaceae bacterium]